MKKGILAGCIVISIIFGMLISYQYVVKKEVENKDNKANLAVSKYNNPYVPQGFKTVETEKASWKKDDKGNPIGWNSGLVIEDEKGNQFVWVPVQSTKIDDELLAYSYDGILKETEREKNQIQKYGGFYIGRYESGMFDIEVEIAEYNEYTNNVVGIPFSKNDKVSWNYISMENAKESAKKMYEENIAVDSDLPTALQYLYVVEWLKNTGVDINDCGKYGNFAESTFDYVGFSSTDLTRYMYFENGNKNGENMIVASGATEYTNTNNIYDIVGNMEEYTNTNVELEDGSIQYFGVGGRYDAVAPATFSSISNLEDDNPKSSVGFRVVLFNK